MRPQREPINWGIERSSSLVSDRYGGWGSQTISWKLKVRRKAMSSAVQNLKRVRIKKLNFIRKMLSFSSLSISQYLWVHKSNYRSLKT